MPHISNLSDCGTVQISVFRGLLQLRPPRPPQAPPPQFRGKKEKIRGFSAQSRVNCLQQVNKISETSLPIFLTLTYHDFVEDFKVWKNHLNQFSTELRKKYPSARGLWKLEFQRRGAPHFHFCLWFPLVDEELKEIFSQTFRDWASNVWLRIIKQEEIENLLYGVCVEVARNSTHVLIYMGGHFFKANQDRKDLETGRSWGFIRKQEIEFDEHKSTVTEKQFFKIRRSLINFLKSKGASRKYLRSLVSSVSKQKNKGPQLPKTISSLCPEQVSLRLLNYYNPTPNPF